MKLVRRRLLTGAAALASCVALGVSAHAFGMMPSFGRLGAMAGVSSSSPGVTNDILLNDATSLLLQTDGSSLVCRAGGC